ncbi:hypothetical protein CQW23_08461 [Capsicum baccatum]|uniref:Uncharacterized protein n=1 Tax=Capsicum baccatum TaxID=33114 RepID=A0A2G2X982_CAPBA|nr:hypothetical protein CQW23_08461 [Capsicum baccatum]
MSLSTMNGPSLDDSMDFVFSFLRNEKDCDNIYRVVDRFLKIAHFIPCHKSDNAAPVATLFKWEIISHTSTYKPEFSFQLFYGPTSHCLDKVTYDEFVNWSCEDCKEIVPNEDAGDNLEATVDRFHLEGWQKNIPRRRRSKRKTVPSRRSAYFLFSPFGNTTSVWDDWEVKVEPRRSERTTSLPRRFADFAVSPSDLTLSGSQGFVEYQHKKRGLFSTTEKM